MSYVKHFKCNNCGHEEITMDEYNFVFCPECYEPDNFTETTVSDEIPYETEIDE